MAQGAVAGLITADDGRVKERTAVLRLAVTQITFGLENTQGRQYRVVGETGFPGERVRDFGYGGGASFPEHLHQPLFGFGQVERFLSRQASSPVTKELRLGSIINTPYTGVNYKIKRCETNRPPCKLYDAGMEGGQSGDDTEFVGGIDVRSVAGVCLCAGGTGAGREDCY